MYSNEMKGNEATKEIHITEREGKKNMHVYILLIDVAYLF
jgi:hypothetical protein